MILETSTYSAAHGYAWSNVPTGLTTARLNELYRVISTARGDFPDPLLVDSGIISDGRILAAFVVQNVENWDANGRASNYAAFAFFPAQFAQKINLIELLNSDFFWRPSHEPVHSIEYTGGEAKLTGLSHLRGLQTIGTCTLEDSRSSSVLLALLGTMYAYALGRIQENGTMQITCTPHSLT